MPNPIKPRRKSLKLTQQAVAEAIGTTKATIMKLEKGDMQLTESWMRRLAGPLKCRPEDLIAERIPDDVPLIGEISMQGNVSLFKDIPPAGMSEPSDFLKGLELVERPPEIGAEKVRALRVIDDALYPVVSSGSILYFSEPTTGGFADFDKKLVVCALTGQGVLVRRLEVSDEFNRYNLFAPNAEPLTNVELQWVAKISFMRLT